MSNTIQSPAVTNTAPQIVRSKPAPMGDSAAFSVALSNAGNGTPYSDADVKQFFAGNPNAKQIAKQAANLGMSEAQIMLAMRVGGYGGNNEVNLRAGIDNYVADARHGYAWDTSGSLVGTRVARSQSQGGISGDGKAMPSEQSIKAFFATGPSEAQQTAWAKELGLTPAQMVQAQVTGNGVPMNQMHAHVLESMYVAAARSLGADIGGRSEGMGGSNGGWTSYFSPALGRAVGADEIKQFFATSPTQTQIFQKASELGIGVSAINNMMAGQGMPLTDAMVGSTFNRMAMSLYQGTDGYSTDQTGRIVAGGGKTYVANADGTANSWILKTT